MDSNELKNRTKKFAFDVIKMINSLPKNNVSNVIGNQLLRASTSIGANYRSACKARSMADFISKITIVEEEADECMYWLELLLDSTFIDNHTFSTLHNEAKKLTAIFTASGKTLKSNK